MKFLLIILCSIAFTISSAQSITVLDKKSVDSLKYHKLQDVEIGNDTIYILGVTREGDIKPEEYILTKVSFEGNIVSQTKITSGRFDFLNTIEVDAQRIFITGGIWNQEDEGVTDYIGHYDRSLNLIWERELENKWEGGLEVVIRKNGVIAASNDNSGVVIHELSLRGSTIRKQRFLSINTAALHLLSDSRVLLTTLTLNQNGEPLAVLNTLSGKFDVLNKSVISFDEKDFYKESYFPEYFEPTSNSKIAILCNGKPPLTAFVSYADGQTQKIKHHRHDISFSDIKSFKDDTYVYSGKLGQLAGVFIIEGNEIIDKASFGNIGTWSTNRLVKVSDTDYILVTDEIVSNDFETNIKIIYMRIN